MYCEDCSPENVTYVNGTRGMKVTFMEEEGTFMYGSNARARNFTITPPFYTRLNLTHLNATGGNVTYEDERLFLGPKVSPTSQTLTPKL